MDIITLQDNWEEIVTERRKKAFENIFKYITDNYEQFEEVIYEDLLPYLYEWEADDRFGTEGARI